MKPTKNTRHTAQFVLVAKISYRDSLTKEVLKENLLQMERCYTRNEARKFIAEWKSEGQEYPGISHDDPPRLFRFRPLNIRGSSNGRNIEEHLDGFEIYTVKEYLTAVKSVV